MLVVYLSNKYIRVVDGTVSKAKINIQGMYYTIDSQGAYLNGTVVNRDALLEMLKELWEVNRLPRKQVYLLLNSNQVTARVLEAPVMKEKDTVAYITRELSGLDRIANPIYGYFRMRKEGKMQRLFSMTASRDYIGQFMEIFKELGVQLCGVESVKGAMVRLAMQMPQLRDKTCAVQFLDGNNLTNVLMVEGKFQSFNEKRLFHEPGEPQYIMEVARAVNEILQFAKAQSIEQPITHTFVAGMAGEDFPLYEEGVQRVSEDIAAEELEGGNVQFYCQRDGEKNFSHFCLAIGALFSSGDENNMVEQMRYSPEQLQKRKNLRKILIPSAVGILGCAAVCGGLLGYNLKLNAQLSGLRGYTEDPAVLEQVGEFETLSVRSDIMVGVEGGLREFLSILEEYPKVDSEIVKIMQDCTEDRLEFEVEGYDASSGILDFQTKSWDVEEIYQFVDRLQDTELFDRIEYTGYSQIDEENYTIKLRCTMAPIITQKPEEFGEEGGEEAAE